MNAKTMENKLHSTIALLQEIQHLFFTDNGDDEEQHFYFNIPCKQCNIPCKQCSL